MPMREAFILSAIGCAVYMVLYILESLWNFVALTPSKLHEEQEATISQLEHEIKTLKPEISPEEMRKRQMVYGILEKLGTASFAVLQTVLDHGEIKYLTLASMRLESSTYQIVRQARSLNLVHEYPATDGKPILMINPEFRSALAFVLGEKAE